MPIQLLTDPTVFLLFAIPLVLALAFHEFAHAWLADQFGDPTPRLAGRVTLNPLAHLDPIGTIALLLAGFGWAKPVPIDSRHFDKPVWQELQVSLAGPFANLALAVATGMMLRLVDLPALPLTLAYLLVQINLTLMIFNLLPIPPLDGSRLLRIALPEPLYESIERTGPLLLLGLLLAASFGGLNLFSRLLAVTAIPLAHLITGISL